MYDLIVSGEAIFLLAGTQKLQKIYLVIIWLERNPRVLPKGSDSTSLVWLITQQDLLLLYRVKKEIQHFYLISFKKMGQKNLDDQHKYQTQAHKQRLKRGKKKIQLSVTVWPQGIHSIMPLDLIHLQKSGAGCKARFTADSDHEKASFPPTFHTQTKSCCIPTPCENHSVESACGTEAPWLKTNTHYEWIHTFALHWLSYRTNTMKKDRPAYGCGKRLLNQH